MPLFTTTVTVTKTIDKQALIQKALDDLALYEIKIGFPVEYKQRELVASDLLRRSGVNLTNPQIAYIVENGDTKLNIPPRPFMIPGIEAALSQLSRMYGPVIRAVINKDSPVDGLIDIGRVGRNSIRNYLLFGDHKALAPATIYMREHSGITLTIPLIETGRMRNALSYMIDLAGHRVYLSPKVREIIPASNVVTKGSNEAVQKFNLMRKVARNRIA